MTVDAHRQDRGKGADNASDAVDLEAALSAFAAPPATPLPPLPPLRPLPHAPTRRAVVTKRAVIGTAGVAFLLGTASILGIRADLQPLAWLATVLVPVVALAALVLVGRTAASRALLGGAATMVVAAFVLTTFAAHALPQPGVRPPVNCMAVVALWCVCSASALVLALRRGFATHVRARLALAAVAIGLGCASLARVFCPHDEVPHILVAHGVPALAALLVLLGLRRFVRP